MKKNNIFKRLFDLLFSLFLLIILSPIIVIISIFVLLIDGFPIFFIQKRSGFKGKMFYLYKFRTMKVEKKSSDRKRVTSFGKLLRNFKLDEIPQLYNVLIGDLSFVGPRPLLPEYNKFYNNQQKLRLTVLPGITGWAQINEKRNTTWNKRINLDIWYVKNRSLKLEFIILLRTIILLIKLIFFKKK